MHIYVKKDVKSLSRIGRAVAHFLKSGRTVQIQYTELERDIVVRFEQRIKSLYGDDIEYPVYPVSGYVKYTSRGIEVSTTKDDTIKATFVLEYDSWGSRFKRATTAISGMVDGLKKEHKERERF